MTTITEAIFAAPRQWFPDAILMNLETLFEARAQDFGTTNHITPDPDRPDGFRFSGCTPIHVHEDIKSWAFIRFQRPDALSTFSVDNDPIDISHWKLHRATGWTIIYEPGAEA